jgi:signal transduction histidine kinase
MAETRDVTIRVADDLPMLVVDAGRLELALVNLLSNAIKYADPAKPTRFVDISAVIDAGGECQIVVRDNGIGIPGDRIHSIFDRFSRAHADLPGVTGVGLGLSIVADCIRTVGGRIEVESVEGIGTTFVISIPQSPVAGPAPNGVAVPS